MDSKTYNLLYDFQKEFLWELYQSSGKPFVNYYGRKSWESSYDPKYTQRSPAGSPTAMPDVSTLPSNRWVVQRPPAGSLVEQSEWVKERDAWLKDRHMKFQFILVTLDGKAEWVHLFKKTSDAVMFKLTWG